MNVLSYAHPQLFNAMVERERLEDDGIGDEQMEIQEILWPIKRLQAKDFEYAGVRPGEGCCFH
jgi:hypothetical protein